MIKSKNGFIRVIFGDQLSDSISSLDGIDNSNDIVLMTEVIDEITAVKHHQKKVVMVLSAMRHFADFLRKKGCTVCYVTLDDPKNTGALDKEIIRISNQYNIFNIIITEPSEYRVLQLVKNIKKKLHLLEIRPDHRFLSSKEFFYNWHKNASVKRMEYFYREIRKKENFLMESSGKPAGGKWNFDRENRRPPTAQMTFPNIPTYSPDKITTQVIHLVNKRFSRHVGNTDNFHYAVTREKALHALDDFITHRLENFGHFQDIMQHNETWLYHSVLSAYINIGLLLPREVCLAVQKAWRHGHVSLNSAEGFIRQIAGWREYVRGIYWIYMPDYANKNFFNASKKLPSFYWDGNTAMNCMHESISQTINHAFSHHIQRLMVTGNFALLAGINPSEVCEWYLAVYADAFEWVELPNTLGMALYGDGGLIASKPYAGSGKYIKKMSNYCDHCVYNPANLLEDDACPFNFLYWHFIDLHKDIFRSNPRMAVIVSSWNKMDKLKKNAVVKKAKSFLNALNQS